MTRWLTILALASVTCTRCDVARGADFLIGRSNRVVVILGDRVWRNPTLEQPYIVRVQDAKLDKEVEKRGGKWANPFRRDQAIVQAGKTNGTVWLELLTVNLTEARKVIATNGVLTTNTPKAMVQVPVAVVTRTNAVVAVEK